MSKESLAFLAAILGLISNTIVMARTLLGTTGPAAKDRNSTTKVGRYPDEIVPIKRSTLKNWAIVSGGALVLSSIGFYLSLGGKSINTVVTLMDVTAAYGSMPFKPNTKVSLNIIIENQGPLPIAQGVNWGAHVTIVPGPESTTRANELFEEFKESLKPVGHGEDLYMNKPMFATRSTRQISEQDVRDLTEGRLLIYLFVYIKYQDTGGEHEAEVCRILQPPGDVPIWHNCNGHNSIR
jgi:hypothetical protein